MDSEIEEKFKIVGCVSLYILKMTHHQHQCTRGNGQRDLNLGCTLTICLTFPRNNFLGCNDSFSKWLEVLPVPTAT